MRRTHKTFFGKIAAKTCRWQPDEFLKWRAFENLNYIKFLKNYIFLLNLRRFKKQNSCESNYQNASLGKKIK